MPGLAHVTAPLSSLRAVKGSRKLPWSDEHQDAFERCKQMASTPITLFTPVSGRGYTIATDASKAAVGAVLKQEGRIVSVFSKKLNKTQQCYDTRDKEALGIYKALRHFRYFIVGEQVVLFTDHKPLLNFF